MNYINFIVTLLLLVGHFESIEAFTVNEKDRVWMHQLNMIKERSETGNDSTKESIKLPQLLNYEYIGEIKTSDDVKRLKKTLIADNSYFPLSDSTMVKVMTLKQLKLIKSKLEIADVLIDISKLLEEIVQVGYGKVELVWKHNSLIFKTICIVSDKGVVYDNIITNMLPISEIKEEIVPIEILDN